MLPADIINELRLLQNSIQIDAPSSLQEVRPHHGAQDVAPIGRRRGCGGLGQQQMDHLHDSLHFTGRMFQLFHFFDLLVGDVGQRVELRILQVLESQHVSDRKIAHWHSINLLTFTSSASGRHIR